MHPIPSPPLQVQTRCADLEGELREANSQLKRCEAQLASSQRQHTATVEGLQAQLAASRGEAAVGKEAVQRRGGGGWQCWRVCGGGGGQQCPYSSTQSAIADH
jgi:hypothetical protein